jgi:hypothetical protein
VSDRDLPNLDEVELPDIPDDDELESAEGEAATLGEVGSRGAPAGGRLGPLLARIAPVAERIGALTAPLGAKATALAAPVGKAVAPIGVIVGPLLARVPRPIMAGVGSFVGVLFVIVVLSSMGGGGRGAAEASAAPVKAAPVKSSAPVAAPPKATARPAHTATPAGPTPSPTPATFAVQEKGWLAIGMAMPNPRQKLIPDRMLFFDDPKDSYRLVANLTVLTRSGPMAPFWGIVLGYEDEQNHLRLEFFADSYDKNRPYAGLFVTTNGSSKSVGPTSRIPNMEFWGRDKHEVVVEVAQPEIVATINGETLGVWQYKGALAPVKKGLYVWGGSRIRFDSVVID